MNNFRKLKTWQKSTDLATDIYEVTQAFPKEEIYGIVSQMRRAVVSISSNIAEGAGRQSDNEFKYFLNIAKGSSYELETQLIISKNLGYLEVSLCKKLIEKLTEIEKMIYALVKTLEK